MRQTQEIDILYLVYPNMDGLMSQLSGVPHGEYPFFENAMSKDGANPIWGILTDDTTIDGWLKGLKGRQNKLYLSVTFVGMEDRPAWCRDAPWHDCLIELMSKAKAVIIIGQEKQNFVYDQIKEGVDPDILSQMWSDSENTNSVLAAADKRALKINIEDIGLKKSAELIYRKVGAKLKAPPTVKRKDARITALVAEAVKVDPPEPTPEIIRRAPSQPLSSEPIPEDHRIMFAERFAICVSAHPAYEKKLPALLKEWDRQIDGLPIKKVVLFDGVPPELPKGWEAISPEKPYGEPAQLRNQALEMDLDWIQYWDADNTPNEDHFKTVFNQAYWAHETVGLIYPNTLHNGVSLHVPDDGDPRTGCYLDTASCWRKEAMLSCGGWQAGMNAEDWALGRDMWLAGWELAPSGVPFKWEATPGNRSEVKYGGQVVWEAKDFAIVILLRGDFGLLEKVKTSLAELEVPRHCGITLMCEGGEEFRSAVEEWIMEDERFERKTVVLNRPAPLPFGANDFMKIHARVGDLYARAFRMTPEEAILTWEDDVQPEPEAFRALSDQLGSFGDVAAVGAPYITRGSEDLAASWGKEWWDSPVKVSEMKDKTLEIGMIAGGWTLWAKAALEDCPMLGPMGVLGMEGFMGWDGFICKRINAAGWRIQLCPQSKVYHKPHE